MQKENLSSAQAPELLVEELSDRIDQMDEDSFDLSAVDACLEELERLEPLAQTFDVQASEKAFLRRHKDLFLSHRALPGGKGRRPAGRRPLRRAISVAAAAALCTAVAAQAFGLNPLQVIAQWSKSQFQLQVGSGQELKGGYVSNLQSEGHYSHGQAALDAYEIEVPMLPTWNPASGDHPLFMEVSVSEASDGELLFTESHRSEDGYGYTFEVRSRSDSQSALNDLIGVEWEDTERYSFDGRTYYISPSADGEYTVTWAVEHYSGKIYGNMDLETARHFARSVTQRDEIPYEPPVITQPPQYQSMEELLTALELSTDLAPTWLPEGFQAVECDLWQSQHSGKSGYLFLSVVEGERNLSLTIDLYPDAEMSASTVYEKDDTPVVEYKRGGITFYIMNNLCNKTVAWVDGRLSGCISGGLTEEECIRIIDSIPYYAGNA